MQQLAHLVSAASHHLKPAAGDCPELAGMLIPSGIDGRIALDTAVQSKQF